MTQEPAPADALPPPAAQAVLRFWFDERAGEDDIERDEWFKKSDAFDEEIERRFAAEIEAALRGTLAHWQATPQGALALVLLLDQFTRNCFRGSARAFSGDPQALAIARRLVAEGRDGALPPLRRWFAYMPFEHAEDLAAQQECVRLFAALAQQAAGGPHAKALAGALDFACRHEVIVRRFGRFPHRNAVLGRRSTPEEVAFLKQPGSGF